MTAYSEILYLVYDIDKLAHTIDLTNKTFIPPKDRSEKWEIDARDSDFLEAGLKFKKRGQEGMTFAEVRGRVHEKYVFIAIDPPKGGGVKSVVRHDLEDFWKCFENGGKGKKGKKEKE